MFEPDDHDPLEKYGSSARMSLNDIQDLVIKTYTKELANYTDEDFKLDPACASEARYNTTDIVSDFLAKEIKDQSILMRLISEKNADLDRLLKECFENVIEEMIDSYLAEK